MDDGMDAREAIDILNTLNGLANSRALSLNDEMRDDVLRLKNFSEYQCKMENGSFEYSYAAAAQAWILVSGTGMPHFERTTYERVIEFSDMAIEELVGTLDIHPDRPTRMM